MGYFVFIFAALMLLVIGEITRQKGFEKLNISRMIDKQYVSPGEEFKITTTLENNKWLPVSFINVEEELPSEVVRKSSEYFEIRGNMCFYVSSYSVLWYERIRRSCSAVINKRGVYYFRKINLSVGDIFGFTYDTKAQEDFQEVVVYPELKTLKELSLENNSLQGESIIKRWIYKDPLYIKAIREYTVEDRMKDIHWKSSLRMNKLMVKDYDYTSDRELVLIINVQCGDPFWNYIDKSAVERSIEVAVSLASQAAREGVSAGLWTDAQIISYSSEFKQEVPAAVNSFKHIMELCARMDYACRTPLHEYLRSNTREFNKNSVYVLITPFLNDESAGFLSRLRRSGYTIKLIDTSRDSELQSIEGIEKICFSGEVKS